MMQRVVFERVRNVLGTASDGSTWGRDKGWYRQVLFAGCRGGET